MVSYIFLGNNIGISAFEVVGYVVSRWRPSADFAMLTVVKQNVIGLTARAWSNGNGEFAKQVAHGIALFVARTGNNSF